MYSGSLAGKDVDAETDYSYFSAYNRIYTKRSPSVECSNENRDGFTVSTSSDGNGTLTYPVGLLTADEVMLAGGIKSTNSNYYLYTGQWYWLLSPSFYYYSAYGFSVDSEGYFGSTSKDYVRYSGGVRPSIVLAKGTRYSSGDGSFTNPYVIEVD